MNQLNPEALIFVLALSILMAGAISLGPAYVVSVSALTMLYMVYAIVPQKVIDKAVKIISKW